MSRARFALLASCGVLFGGMASAQAADLGGDCCADLEERIAELEATTARKGNRKVSLEISGHVNEAVMFWDDGAESNVYVVGNDSGRTRVRFKGKAKIDKDWEAGYRIELGFRTSRSDRVDQGGFDYRGNALDGDDPAAEIDIRYSEWYIKSKTFGEVHVGQTESGAESVTESNVTQTGDIAKNGDVEDHIAGFQLRAEGGSGPASLSDQEWRRIIKANAVQPGEGSRGNYVHYISPAFADFHVHATWGEDDYWDVGLKYHGEIADFKLAAGIAYGQGTDVDGTAIHCTMTFDSNFPATNNGNDADCHQLGGSISALHEPTGLFVTFGAGKFEDENAEITPVGQADLDPEHTFYAVQAGIEKKWLPLGKTTIYGEYFDYEGGSHNDRRFRVGDPLNPFAAEAFIQDSEVQTYGGGIVQGIDAAAMRMYMVYRHYEADLTLRTNAGAILDANPIEDVDVVVGGALIKF